MEDEQCMVGSVDDWKEDGWMNGWMDEQYLVVHCRLL